MVEGCRAGNGRGIFLFARRDGGPCPGVCTCSQAESRTVAVWIQSAGVKR